MNDSGHQISDPTISRTALSGVSNAIVLPFFFTDGIIGELAAQFASMEEAYATLKRTPFTIAVGKLHEIRHACDEMNMLLTTFKFTVDALSGAADMGAQAGGEHEEDDEEDEIDPDAMRSAGSPESGKIGRLEKSIASEAGKSPRANYLKPIASMDLIDSERSRTCFTRTFL